MTTIAKTWKKLKRFIALKTCICNARWTSFHPEHWTTQDVSEWLEFVCTKYSIPAEDITDLKEAFENVDGTILLSLDIEELQQRTAKYGDMLRSSFKDMCFGVPTSIYYGASKFPPIAETDTTQILEEIISESSEKSLVSNDEPVWSKQHPSTWASEDVSEVLKFICRSHNVSKDRTTCIIKQFAGISGNMLIKMQKHEFKEKALIDGELLFNCLKDMFSFH